MEGWLQLRPTPDQYHAFSEYLCNAHSWYKHLPLLDGRRFVVFVAADAGIGRLVAVLHGSSPETATGYSLVTPPEGPEFTDEHPRLHYGWKTTKEYHTRFGYLDYMARRGPDEPYGRDAGPPVELPAEVQERCGFVLYPYVSGMFAEAITWSVHEEALRRLRAGDAHPARELVLELANLAEAHQAAWSALGDTEREWVLAHDTESGGPVPGGASADVGRYLELGERVRAVMASLHAQEAEKVRRALAALDGWLLHGS